MGFALALAAAGTAAGLTVTGLSGAALGGTSSTDPDGVWRHRLVVECARVPHAIDRATRLQHRLAADDSTRGSLARLHRQADRAAAAGHPAVAKLIGDRIALRQQLADQLPERLRLLNRAKQDCAAAQASPTSRATPGTGSTS